MPTKLGQNFLINPTVATRIVQSAALTPEDVVIEVGPGTGAITTLLAQHAKDVLAIELDPKLAEDLTEKYATVDNIHIIHNDILKTHITKILPQESYKVVANVPYYITSKITRFFLEQDIPPQQMILMIQKEVAQRITAAPGAMSILSVSVQYYAQPEYLFTVPAESFNPVPKVESAVIKITPQKPNERPEKSSHNHFFRAIKSGFSAKRKTLSNNLANGFHTDKNTIAALLKECAIAPNVRAQELSLPQWHTLVKKLEEKGFYDHKAV